MTFGLAYVTLSFLSKKNLSRNGRTVAREQSASIRISQEGLGAIRDVILQRRQQFFGMWYLNSVSQLASAMASNQFITLAPRYLMETIALVLIGFFTFYASGNSEFITSLLPTLGALALGAQRLLPILQQLYGNYGLVIGSHQSLVDVLILLDQPKENHVSIQPEPSFGFHEKIILNDVSFRYSTNDSPVLKNVNIEIKKANSWVFGRNWVEKGLQLI